MSRAAFVKACHANATATTAILKVIRSSTHSAFNAMLERKIQRCTILDESLHGLVPKASSTISPYKSAKAV